MAAQRPPEPEGTYDPTADWHRLAAGAIGTDRFLVALRGDGAAVRFSFAPEASPADWAHYEHTVAALVERAHQVHGRKAPSPAAEAAAKAAA